MEHAVSGVFGNGARSSVQKARVTALHENCHLAYSFKRMISTCLSMVNAGSKKSCVDLRVTVEVGYDNFLTSEISVLEWNILR